MTYVCKCQSISCQSENFAPADEDFAGEFGISWDSSVHGSRGPVQSSYPVFAYESISMLFHLVSIFYPQLRISC